jgi:predicted small lipoprotein YifL
MRIRLAHPVLALTLLCVALALTACGRKPGELEPPPGQQLYPYPPASSTP